MHIIIFIIVLAVLVFVHELGHFLAAKLFGVRVDEFALGFPPKIASFKMGETRYALNAIPFGGYVKIFGEDYEKDTSAFSEKESYDKDRHFANKPKIVQTIILAAGIFFNIVFAWLLISLGFMTGMPVPQDYAGPGLVKDASVIITSVQLNSPAETAGIKPGDSVQVVSDELERVEKPNPSQIQEFIEQHPNTVINFEISHNGENRLVEVVPSLEIDSNKVPKIGITMESLGTIKLPFFSALWEGVIITGDIVAVTAVGIVKFIGTAIVGQAHISDVTGPVGIAGLVSDATRLGFVYLISFTAFISINLAIINLIPFPALDGGRILFVILEKIRGKALNYKIVHTINAIGLGLLLLLMLVVTYHDISLLWK